VLAGDVCTRKPNKDPVDDSFAAAILRSTETIIAGSKSGIVIHCALMMPLYANPRRGMRPERTELLAILSLILYNSSPDLTKWLGFRRLEFVDQTEVAALFVVLVLRFPSRKFPS
jgi:hypothetical protein